MTNVQPEDDQEEKPLDPAMESVRRKMIRLQIVSGVIMFVSLMAVFGAVVYKTMRAPAKEPVASASTGIPSDAPVSVTANLPSGFVIQSSSLSGGQIMFFGATADGVLKSLVFDIKAGRIVADITVNGG
jgi:putative copper export protein